MAVRFRGLQFGQQSNHILQQYGRLPEQLQLLWRSQGAMLEAWRVVQGELSRRLGGVLALINGATSQDAVCISVPAGVQLDRPVHIVYLSSGVHLTAERHLILFRCPMHVLHLFINTHLTCRFHRYYFLALHDSVGSCCLTIFSPDRSDQNSVTKLVISCRSHPKLQ